MPDSKCIPPEPLPPPEPPRLTAADLAQFWGSETVYRHPLMRDVLYTEGVEFLAKRGGAFWLIDIIASHQLEPKVVAEEFQHWVLKVNEEERSAVLSCDDGNGRVVATQAIEYTDFPLPGIALYFCNRVIMLPSEY